MIQYFKNSPNNIEVKTFNINKPMVMLDSKILNCYVHNFNLYFMTADRDGDVLNKVKLKNSMEEPDFSEDWFKKWLNDYDHKKTFKVRYGNSNLFLSGYNFVDFGNGTDVQYPVFAPFKSKIYFQKEYAEELCKKYNVMFKGKLKVV